jgi:DNA-binding ferritin-like protein
MMAIGGGTVAKARSKRGSEVVEALSRPLALALAVDAIAERIRSVGAPAPDLAVQRIQVHEKNAWMLRSHLD